MEEGQAVELPVQKDEKIKLAEKKKTKKPDEPQRVKQVTFLEKPPKKIRKRIKGTMNQLRAQVEFYFGDSNMSKDRFMKQETDKDPEGYMPLTTFLKFNKVKELSDDVNMLSKALKLSEMLQLSEDGTKVRRKTPVKFLSKEEIDARTVYVEGFARHKNREWLKRLFSRCGKVAYVSLPHFKTSSDNKGFAFIEFEKPEDTATAIEMLNRVVDTPEEKPAHKVGGSIKQGKNLVHWKKRASKEGIDPADLDAALKDVSKGEGTEEESAKEGTKSKSKSKKKKKKKRAASDATTTAQKADQPAGDAGSITLDESKENATKMEEQTDGVDTQVKKSKKAKKKKKRKNDPSKTKSEEVSGGMDDATDAVQKTEKQEGSADEPEVSGKTDEGDTAKSEEMSSKSEDQQGSRKRQRSRDSSCDEVEVKAPKLCPEPDVEAGKEEKVKDTVEDNMKASDRVTKVEDIKAVVTDKKHPTEVDTDRKQPTEVDTDRKQPTEVDTDRKQPTEVEQRDSKSGAEDSAKESEPQTLKEGGRKRKKGKETSEVLQEKSPKCKKHKEGKLPAVQGSETVTGDREGRKRKRKSLGEVSEEGTQKKKKRSSLSQTVDTADEEEEGKKKRHRHRKQPEPPMLLRVMTKEKWVKLKEDYLEQQKANMRILKEHVKMVSKQKREQKEKQIKNEEDNESKRPAPEFVPNAILKIRSDVGLCLQDIKADIPAEIQVAYIDVKPSMAEGHIRLKDEQNAKSLLKAGIRDCKLALVQGEAEKLYWDKLINDRLTKLSNPKRRKTRGKHKILQQAQTPQAESSFRQHFKFKDED